MGQAFHHQKLQNLIAHFKTDAKAGLSFEEVEKRLKIYGLNNLGEEKRTPWYVILVRQYQDFLIYILAFAALSSFLLGEEADAWTIVAILILNGVLGFIQEFKAENSLSALKKMLSPFCHVLRNGESHKINVQQLVPGDFVIISTGDIVPADLRIVESHEIYSDEAVLTGESESLHKVETTLEEATLLHDKKNMLWMGATITSGSGIGLVVSTGKKTQFGKIAKLTSLVTKEMTPLQKKLNTLGKQLGLIAIVISMVIVFVGWLRGASLLEVLMEGISLAVAVVPEGLPAVVTITLALGIKAMAKRNALIKRLPASETLGSTEVICTDKTGTLTKNQMTVQNIWTASGVYQFTGVGYSPEGNISPTDHDLNNFFSCATVCTHTKILQKNSLWIAEGNPTEGALITASLKAKFTVPQHTIIRELSFNSTRKRMSVAINGQESIVIYSKGAPEIILNTCSSIQHGKEVLPLTKELIERVSSAIEENAAQGLRTLGLSMKIIKQDDSYNIKDLEENDLESEQIFLGFAAILDPPRVEVPRAIQKAKEAGLKVLMITGDSPITAQAIAKKINLSTERCFTGTDIDKMSREELAQNLSDHAVVARATPKQKLDIVTALQQNNKITAMTGDGVNDAPALKKAHIGIAMGIRGTDVSKSAADMILLDDNFNSIVEAIEEGRRQFDNIQKFIRYLLSSNLGELLAISLNIFWGGPLILLPVQILWMNLITDSVTAVTLGLEPKEPGIMKRPPRPSGQKVLGKKAIIMIALLGGYLGPATLGLYHYYEYIGRGEVAQTVAFMAIVVHQKINVLNYRSLDCSLFKLNFFSNKYLLVAIVFSIALQVSTTVIPFFQNFLHTTPLELKDWGLIVLVGLPVLLLGEIYKRLINKFDIS
jgi:P-type Ca2+ transporter type 2C